MLRRLFSLSAVTLLALVFSSASASAAGADGDSACARAGKERVAVRGGNRAHLLEWYVTASCRASRAVLEGCAEFSPARRKETCRREVLAGAHIRTCVYFRDELSPEAYEPCEAWVMEQYERCTEGDMEWFRPEEEDPGQQGD